MVLFRVDSSLNIGSGHFTRCLVLTDLLKKNGIKVAWISKDLPGAHWHLLGGVTHYKIPANLNQEQDALSSQKIINEHNLPVNCIVVDNYFLDATWESHFSNKVKIFVIDDLANRSHACDVILDYNYKPDHNKDYSKLIPTDCLKLFGPDYFLAKNIFLEKRNSSKNLKKIQSVMVFFGGSDPDKITFQFLKELKIQKNDLLFNVVVTKGNAAFEEITNTSWPENITIHTQPDNIANVMSESDVYFGSGGTITWERFLVGLPGFVIAIADNQESVAKYLHKKKHQYYLGSIQNVPISQALKAFLNKVSDVSSLQEFRENNLTLVRAFPEEALRKIFVEDVK